MYSFFQYTVFFEKDEKVKAEKTKKVFGETLPTGLVFCCQYITIQKLIILF